MPVPYIIIKNETVVYSGMGDIIPEEATVLESPYEGALDIPISWLHADYTPKTDIELIQEGLKNTPPNMRILDNELVPYTEEDYKILNEIRECESKLSQTDWYVIRFIDCEKGIPSEIKKERQRLRDRISELKEKI